MRTVENKRMEHSAEKSGKLSLFDLTLIGCGATFGSGWLFAASRAATLAGPWALFAWMFGGVIALFLGIIYCELGAALPRKGGVVWYPYFSHGRFLGFMVSFVTVVAFSSIVSIEVVAARQYGSIWFPFLSHPGGNPTLTGWLAQAGMLMILCYFNMKDGKTFAWINNIITILKFSVPALVVVTIAKHFSLAPFHVPVAGSAIKGVVTALSSGGIIFAFLGLTPIVAAAGEARNPKKTIPGALFISVGFTTLVYLVLQSSFIGALPALSLIKGWGPIQDNFPLPFHDIMIVAGVAWVASLVLVDACVSPLGTGNVFLNSTFRVSDAWLAEAGLLPPNARKTGPVSTVSVLFSMVLCIFWTLPFPSWNSLVGVVSTAIVMSYAFVPVILASLRRTCPALPRPFKVPALQVIGPLSFIMSSFVVLWAGWKVVFWLLSAQIFLGVVYLVFSCFRIPENEKKAFLISNLWILVYFLGVIVFSYLDQNLDMETLEAPGRLVLFVSFLTIIYFWGSRSGLSLPVPLFIQNETPSNSSEVLK